MKTGNLPLRQGVILISPVEGRGPAELAWEKSGRGVPP